MSNTNEILKAVLSELETNETNRVDMLIKNGGTAIKSEYYIVEKRIEDQWDNVHFDTQNEEMVSWFSYLPEIKSIY